MTQQGVIKHWDCIVALKEGKEIEIFENERWARDYNPHFHPHMNYRIMLAKVEKYVVLDNYNFIVEQYIRKTDAEHRVKTLNLKANNSFYRVVHLVEAP